MPCYNNYTKHVNAKSVCDFLWNKKMESEKNKTTQPIIKIQNLRVIYNQGKSNEVRSLEDVSLAIYPREYIIIYGPSGCGKSTLLYSIAGLQIPTYGEVTIGDKKISQMSNKDKVILHQTGTGMIFQAFHLIPSLNVIGNVCLPKSFCGERKKSRNIEGMKLLQRFSISEQFKKFPSQLSGGQKQRVAIARALANNPQILLADEPVGNLDSESAENVMKILKELNEVDKKTIILVTHNPDHLHYADRVIHIKDGRIIKEDVNFDKRPRKIIRKEVFIEEKPKISKELEILGRTFKNLSAKQTGALLIPFKSKQLLHYILSQITDEQLGAAENLLKEFLFKNIDMESLRKKLDTGFEKGGANWNKKRAESFIRKMQLIFRQVEIIKNNPEEAPSLLANYLADAFNIELDNNLKNRFQSFLRMRIENKIDRLDFQKRLDAPIILRGLGLYKNTAEKIAIEMEVIMLLGYST